MTRIGYARTQPGGEARKLLEHVSPSGNSRAQRDEANDQKSEGGQEAGCGSPE